MISVHGGGWRAGNKETRHQYAEFFNELGFVVVTPNYRLVTEDGQHTFPTLINDVGCAVAWIKRNATTYGADGSTVFISGNSACAHISALLAYNSERNWLKECSIQDEEITFKGFIGTSGVYDFGDTTRELFHVGWLLRDALGLEVCTQEECAWKAANPAPLVEASPLTFVSPDDPPALLATGEDDCFINLLDRATRHCTATTVRMADALSQVGIYNQLVVFPGYGHGGYQELFYDGQEIVGFLRLLVGP